jgi:hypothetical protein
MQHRDRRLGAASRGRKKAEFDELNALKIERFKASGRKSFRASPSDSWVYTKR